MTRLALIGASGRMGRAVVRAANGRSDITLVAAIVSPGSAHRDEDVGILAGVASQGLKTSVDLAAGITTADVVVDFSSGEATATNIAACLMARKPLLIGTTGFSAETHSAARAAARTIPVMLAPNTSLGVALLTELVRTAARLLPAEFDIEILDLHHRTKRDAPSGTALALGEAAATARGQSLEQPVYAGVRGPRRPGQIGFAAVRGGDLVGEHQVLFLGPGERLSLAHEASERGVFALGALQAAAWLSARPAGEYSMRDFVSYKSAG